ncbi:hypothetical protein AIOL_000758 [Candidatus Rhodobacter oscarellae]|uniref:N-formylglutamate amidohydrolase n=2 Tax=Candidatus Rhodobacter oscarellae TaxID=1675527 RepID=A0A0J9EFX1_9RHOB|nr:N-formylglutamate amidohydrolase [Candidatus Rhodobacter lobularis]KMW60594.1 hypothetical protein AIOL_000758 [Candidatus Rhodobacter lobularis]
MTTEAFEVEGAERKGPWLLTCDHASNAVPGFVSGGDLGLAAADMNRHIAYDVGAAGVTRHLARLLDAPCVLSRFSRLVIDPNRGEDDPTLIMQLYDGTLIPGNRVLEAKERARRLDRLYRPYHSAVDQLLAGRDATYVAIHSFTPQLNGRPPRPWHVTVLSTQDKRFSDPLLERLGAEPDLCIAENEPYTGELRGDGVDRHAVKQGRPNALIEIRNDLIETASDQQAWAERLAPLLRAAHEDMRCDV